MANNAKDKAKQQIRKQGAKARDVLILQKAMNDTGKNIVHIPSARTAPVSAPTIAPETPARGAGVGSLAGLGMPTIPAYESVPVISAPKSDAEIIAEYEAIPNYGLFTRMGNKDKQAAYKQKQALSQDYNNAINRQNLDVITQSGITEDDIRRYIDLYGDVENPEFNALSKRMGATGLNPVEIENAIKSYRKEADAQAAKEMPVLSSVNSIFTKPMESAYGTGSDVINYLSGKPIQAMDSMTQNIRGTVSKDMSNAGKWFYNTAMSGGDMLMSLALASLMGGGTIRNNPVAETATRVIQALEKANDTADNATNRGLTPTQIMAEMGASGITTYLASKQPLEKLLNPGKLSGKFWQDLAMYVGKNALSEGTEEAIENVADALADRLIAKDKSQISMDTQAILANNPQMTEREAATQAIRNFAWDTVLEFAGGAAVGGLMAGGNFMLNSNIRNYSSQNADNNVEKPSAEPEEILAVDGSAEPQITSETQSYIDDLARQQNDLAVELADVNAQIKKTNGDERRELRHRASVLKQEIADIDNQINSIRETGEIPSANVPVEENTDTTPQDVLALEPQTQNGEIQANKVEPASDEEINAVQSQINSLEEEKNRINAEIEKERQLMYENIDASDFNGNVEQAAMFSKNYSKEANQHKARIAELQKQLPQLDEQIADLNEDLYGMTQTDDAELQEALRGMRGNVGETETATQPITMEEADVSEASETPAEILAVQNMETDNVEAPRTYRSENVTEGDLSADDIRERGYSDTLKNKTDAPEELKSQFMDNPSFYRQLHNKDTQAMADGIFESYDLNDALSMCNAMIATKDPASVPLAHRISKALVEQGRMDDAVTLTNALAQSLTEAGQFTQAVTLNMLNDNPVAALTYIERAIDAMNNAGLEKFGKKWHDFELTEEERQMFADIEDGDTDAINEAYDFIYSRIAREYPVKMLDKLYEFVRVGLLCNMRSFVRNFVGNGAMLPTRWTAGRVTALAEWAYSRKNKNYTRTEHGLGPISKESKALAESIYDARNKELFDSDDAKLREVNDALRNKQVFKGTKLDEMIDKGATWVANSGIKLTGPVLKYLNNSMNGALQKICDIYDIGGMESLSDVINGKTANRQINPSVIETVRNFAYYMLGELGDEPFVKLNFVQKLSSYIEQNNVTSAEELPQDAIMLATQEANKATFRDHSSIAKGLEKLRQGFNNVGEEIGIKRLGDFIVMFARTPGNIGSRMLEYSPYGLAKATINAVKSDKAIQKIEGRMNEINNDLENNEHTTGETQKLQKELKSLKKQSDEAYYSMTQALTLLGQGATGTLGVLIGWLLRKNGLIFGGLSDDKKEKAYQKDVQGLQENSVKIGNYSYSIDFLNALSPLVFGAVACEAFSENDGDFAEACKKAGISVLDAWINSTPLQNVASVFDGYGSAAENVIDTILNIPTMGVPSQVGAIARIGDRTVRNAYDPTSTTNTIKNNIVAKLPGLSKTLPASYDAWGREKQRQDSTGAAMFAQLVNPGTTKSYNPTDIDEDILNLYNSMDRDTRVLPRTAESSYKIGNETFRLDNVQKSEFQRIMGENSYEFAKSLINSDSWKTMSNEAKAKTLDSMYKFSEALAKRVVLGAEIAEGSSNYKIAQMYDGEGRDAVVNYLSDKYAYESTMDKYGITQNDTTREMYDNNDTKAMQKYAKALDLAKKYGKDSISETEWKIYNSKGAREFEQYVKASTSLKNADISNNAFARNYYQLHGDSGLQTLEKAYEEIPTIKIGVDEYGDDKYLEVNEKTFGIWEDMGKRGVEGYAEVAYTDVNHDGSISLGNDMIPTLEKMYSYSNEEKGRLLEEANGSIANGAKQAYEDKGYEGIYMYYLIKYSAPSTKAKEIKSYIDRMSLSPAEKEYYKSLF